MPLRCSYDIQTENGPGGQNLVVKSGVPRMKARWFPILETIAGQYALNVSFPLQWTPIIPTYMRPSSNAMSGDGSLASLGTSGRPWYVEFSPNTIAWFTGRGAWKVQAGYLNGWPVTTLAENANIGDTVLNVVDVTGWYIPMADAQLTYASPYMSGTIYDGSSTEDITATGNAATSPITSFGQTIQVGPGTITLQTPLMNTHVAGTLVSTLPQDVNQAAIYRASYDALMQGANAVNVPSISGGLGTSSSLAGGDFDAKAKELLQSYRRII